MTDKRVGKRKSLAEKRERKREGGEGAERVRSIQV